MKVILKDTKNDLTSRIIHMIGEYANDGARSPKEQALILFRLGYDSFEEAFDTEEEVLEFLEEHKTINYLELSTYL